ncbi:MAG: polar amino acid transport system substrate-binding protein [Pseudohongiellaceae bacterium]|jgi:polar amino acid transport system substrate-binding protein
MRLLAVVVVNLALLFVGSFSLAETVTLVADEWCPYSCKDTNKPGIGIEIARSAFEQQGFDVEYKVNDRAQALEYVKEHPMAVLVGTTKVEAPELVFPQYNVSFTRLCFIHNIKGWHFKKLSSFNNLRLGVVLADNYGGRFDRVVSHMKDQRRIKVYPSTAQLLAAYLNNEVDIMLDDKHVVKHALQQKDINAAYDYDNCSRRKLMLAFSPKDVVKSELLAKRLDVVLLKMLKNGEVKAIHQRYGVVNY